MTFREKFDFFVVAYLAALGQDKPIPTRIEILKESQTVICIDDLLSAEEAALEWVTWKLLYGNKPKWLKR